MKQVRGNASSATAEPTDGELLERFTAHREEGAFAELVRRHGPMVVGVCRRVLDDAEDVEDAFQATFMILVRKAGSIRKRDSAAGWLFGVALRVARRARVSIKRRRERERRAAVSEEAVAHDEAWRDLRPVLDNAVDALPEKFRDLVVLCYMQGHTYAEAAELLHLAVGTVSTRLTGARNLLKNRLTRRGVVLPVAVLAILLEKNAAPAAVPAQLPALALEGGKVAAGMGGSVSAQVAALTNVGLRGSSFLAPVIVAILAGLLALMTGGLLLYRAFGPGRNAGGNAEADQNWKQGFSREGQRFVAYGIRFSPDEKLGAWQDGEFKIRVAELDSGKEVAAIQMPTNGANMVANMSYPRFLGFTPDNRGVISVLDDVRIWDISTQNEVGRFPGGWVAAWGPDGKTLATASGDGAIHLIDIPQRRERSIEERLPGPITALAFDPDGKSLAVGARDGAVVFYDLEKLQRQRRLPGNAEPTLELAFSADGSYLAVLHGDPNAHPAQLFRTARVWQLEAETKIDLIPQRITALTFVPHTRLLCIQELDGRIGTWDPVTGERVLDLYSGGRMNTMLRLVISPDGKHIVTRDALGNALLRSLATGKTVATLSHTGLVADAAYTSDGRRLLTGTLRGTEDAQSKEGKAEVKLWDRLP